MARLSPPGQGSAGAEYNGAPPALSVSRAPASVRALALARFLARAVSGFVSRLGFV